MSQNSTVKLPELNRNATALVVGLLASLVILVQQPLRSLLDLAYEVEVLYQLDLVPALVALCSVLLFYRVTKRHETKLTQARMSEVTRLGTLAQALTNVVEQSALEAVLRQQFPRFVDQRDYWVLLPRQGRWEPFLAPSGASAALGPEQIEALVRQGVEDAPHADQRGDTSDYSSWPMRHGGQTIGLVIVRHDPPLSQTDTQALSAVTALVSTATNTVRLIADLHRSGVTDELTGCASREHGLMRLDGELRRVRRSTSSLTVIMLDIDTFKAVNDQYGHLVGDTVLAAVGESLARTLRSTDVRCRYGGDEFLLVLPETSLDRAIHVADRVRQGIADLAIPANGHTLRITASLGVSGIGPDELDPLAVVARADTALYDAKRGGRNQCHVAEIPKERTVSESEGLVIASQSGTRLALGDNESAPGRGTLIRVTLPVRGSEEGA